MLDFANEKGEVWLRKTKPWGGNSVVFDVGRHMFVMRMGASQRGIVGMSLRIIPVEFDVMIPNFISVKFNNDWPIFQRKMLAHGQPIAIGPVYCALQNRKTGPRWAMTRVERWIKANCSGSE